MREDLEVNVAEEDVVDPKLEENNDGDGDEGHEGNAGGSVDIDGPD